jgi:serine/threonine-protein kinase
MPYRQLGSAVQQEDERVETSPGCLSDEEIACFVEGTPGGDTERVQHHIDLCAKCRLLVAETATSPLAPRSSMALDKREDEAAVSAAAYAPTLPSGTGRPPSAPTGLDLDHVANAEWDRYELLAPLGRGGMGAVYKARDRRLGRIVALKFILGATPSLTLRFVQEARAQARIDHPNVCRVYEAGEYGGRAYIAMQFVDGEQLGHVAPRLSLDEKVTVARDIALAIHEAHKLGIIHRDIKPPNVLVGRGEDGRWFPVVMDFGLARELSNEVGLTQSGALLGTPAYMAPEQACGDSRAIDRRADVYSLGATLYELLTGQPPFAYATVALTLDRLLHAEPTAPRSLAPSLPIDLETVVLKCLDKEPERRYGSARALADDLARYLDGDPVLGRPPSLWHRLRRRARRNRALVTVSATSLVALTVVAGLGVRTFIASRRERARAAQVAERLGREANENEWRLRASYQLPLHDTTTERELVRARMRRVAATRHELGALGDAAIHEALGRGHLALHEWAEAADELARAAAAGADTPALHAARGRALGELYQRALEEARRSGDRDWLAARRRELERELLALAVAELDRSRGEMGDASDESGAQEALVALYRRDFALATKLATEAIARAPWLLDVRQIAADALYQEATEALDHGAYDRARTGLTRACALYDEAAGVARSDASVHEASARAWVQRGEIELRQGRVPKREIDEALTAADRAIVANPREARAWLARAWALLLQNRAPALRPSDMRGLFERIADAAAHAVAIDPRDAGGWDTLGNAHFWRGAWEMRHGGDPMPSWRQALTELGRALELRPNDPWANNDIGAVHRWIGRQVQQRGGDPMPEYDAALRRYEEATRIDPEYVFAYSNQADVSQAIADYQTTHGLDPNAAVARARRAGERCLTIDPSLPIALALMARAETVLAQFLYDAQGDPRPALARARDDAARALRLDDNDVDAHIARLEAANIEARWRLRIGGDPTRALADGRVELAAALERRPDCWACEIQAAWLDLVAQAAAPTAAGQRRLHEALSHARNAIARNDQVAGAKVVAARVCLRLASAGEPSSVQQGLAYVDAALALDPNDADAHAVKAALLRRSGSRDAANAEAERAFAINPRLRAEWSTLISASE